MKTLSNEQMLPVTCGAGRVVNAVCGVVTVGSAVYTVGALASWWNPVGWVCGAMLLADVACFGMTLRD